MGLCNWFKSIATLLSPRRHTSLETSRIRVAQPSDLKDVVEVFLAAMPDDPAWDYRFPHRQEYKKDHLNNSRCLLEWLINPSHDDWEVQVLECSSNSLEWKIVALAVWDVSFVNLRRCPSHLPQDPSRDVRRCGGRRRHANMKHARAFQHAMMEAREKFKLAFGIDQIHLQILGTHPAYRRRGFGTALCKSGMKRAELERVVLTVMASPLGFDLYSSLNFRDRGTQTVQVPGEAEKLIVHAMDFVPDSVRSGFGLMSSAPESMRSGPESMYSGVDSPDMQKEPL